MGFLDIERGWHQEIFDLIDVSILRRVELQEQDEDGNWGERSASYVDASKFENPSQLRYSGIQGTLSGKARYSDHMDSMFLGVPEDKDDGFSPEENRVGSISVQISTVPDDDLAERIRKGRVHFLEGSEYNEECVYTRLYISEERFAEICRAAAEPDVTFHLGMNINGWHWLGPIGDSKVFFPTNGFDEVELAFISVSRKVPNPTQADWHI